MRESKINSPNEVQRPEESALFFNRDSDRKSQTKSRYRLRSLVNWNYSPQELRGVRSCGRRAIGALVDYSSTGSKHSVGGVGLCRHFACPVCAHKRTNDQSAKLTSALQGATAEGWENRFITLTHPSTAAGGKFNVSIQQQYEYLSKAKTKFIQRLRARLRYLFGKSAQLAFAFSYDITFNSSGKANLHIHGIVGSNRQLEDLDFEKTWKKAYKSVHPMGDKIHLFKRACYVEAIESGGLTNYVYKAMGVAQEVVGSAGKTKASGSSFTIRGLVEKLATDPTKLLANLYSSLLLTFKGKTWATLGGFNQFVVEDINDEQLESEEDQAEKVEVSVSKISHHAICSLLGLELVLDSVWDFHDIIKQADMDISIRYVREPITQTDVEIFWGKVLFSLRRLQKIKNQKLKSH